MDPGVLCECALAPPRSHVPGRHPQTPGQCGGIKGGWRLHAQRNMHNYNPGTIRQAHID